MDQPSAYSPRYPSGVILIVSLLVVTLLGFLAGYFFSKLTNLNSQPQTISTRSNLPTPNKQAGPSIRIPIATNSSAVKSLWVVYLLSGVIDSITPVNDNGGVSGYEIQLSSPTGPLIQQKFFIADKITNVVLLDSKGKETKYQLSSLKKTDSIQLNFQLDAKNPTNIQVTKIAVLK